MDKRLKEIIVDIKRGQQLEETIPQLLNQLANHYYTYAGIRLAMHYETLYEEYCDRMSDVESHQTSFGKCNCCDDTHETASHTSCKCDVVWSKEAQDTVSQLNQIIYDLFDQNWSVDKQEKSIKAIDTLRNEIKKRVQIITTYTDIFQIYEYILNRLEYKFKSTELMDNDEEFTREILRYIFDTEDNYTINEKIKEIIGQLPIKITKQKYYELLKDSIKLYQGANLSSFESYLYMLRTSAMLYPMEGMEECYPELLDYKTYLSSLNFKEINEKEFMKSHDILKEVTTFLDTEASFYYNLIELVNEVYAVFLNSPYTGLGVTKFDIQVKTALTVIRTINEKFLDFNKDELPDDILKSFVEMEGVQEIIFEDLFVLEDALYQVNTNYINLTESLMLKTFLHVILRTKDLLSNSLFIDFNENMKDCIVDDQKMIEETDKLLKDLANLFVKQDRMVGRAIIANTINKMPVFFQNHNEVMAYVRNSIEGCTNLSEKAACIEIIKDIISE